MDHERTDLLRSRLSALVRDPPSMIPHNKEAVRTLSNHVNGMALTPEQTYWTTSVMGPLSYHGFMPIDDTYEVKFPRDHGVHDNQQADRWQFVGRLWNEQVKYIYVVWDMWIVRTVPNVSEKNRALCTLLKSSATLWMPSMDRMVEFPSTTRSLDEASTIVSESPFSIVVGEHHLRSLNEARTYPMELRIGQDVDSSVGTVLTLDLTQVKHRFTQNNVNHGIGVIALGVPELDAAGSLRMDGRTYSVSGSMSTRHEWNHGTVHRYYPDGFVQQCIETMRSWHEDGAEISSAMNVHVFLESKQQIVANCRKVQSGPFMDFMGISDHDGGFQSTSRGLLMLAEDETSGFQILSEDLKINVTATPSKTIRRNLMSDSIGGKLAVYQTIRVGQVQGTVSSQPVNGYYMQTIDLDEDDEVHLANVVRLLGINIEGARDTKELGRKFLSGRSTAGQNAKAVMFWIIPLTLLVLVVSMGIFLYQRQMMPAASA